MVLCTRAVLMGRLDGALLVRGLKVQAFAYHANPILHPEVGVYLPSNDISRLEAYLEGPRARALRLVQSPTPHLHKVGNRVDTADIGFVG